jgi:hypothetical protein
MITIYSVDTEGRLFTDPKQHFFIDAALLQEKATAKKIQFTLDQIAARFGYKSGEELTSSLACAGYVVNDLILSGNLVSALTKRWS